MDDALLAAYRATAYRVRLARGGWAALRVGHVPPDALQTLIGARPWGFVTAWNPHSQPSPRTANRRAQRALLDALHTLPEIVLIRAGCGAGADGWREPSLFVVGPTSRTLDRLAARCEQYAYLHGQGAAPAQLRLLRG